ncbi:hypothetical protein GCM10027515_18090 [Schumannella luteola]|uniref:Tfp pilus assembly protein PilV n=1 Tax=Schumannella luteola TaxID=472059 RepID=A0A852YGG0_9MICO|nr:hypothetical protein [Schumannella luteola]NYH00395.1 Tfp pilus assembly protein PilV [Schumannella luteola]TPW90935.1 hypothetical protein FJ656_36365 [Schumannella luteola]
MSDGRTPHDDEDPLGLGFGENSPAGAAHGSAEEPPPTEPLSAGDRPWTPADGTPAADAAGDAPTTADPFPWLNDPTGGAGAAGANAGADAAPPANDDVTQVFGAVPPAAPPSQAATTVYPTGYATPGAAPAAKTTATRFDPNLFTPLASTGGDDEPEEDEGPSKKPLIILGSIGGVLVIGIAILLIVLFTRGGGDAEKDSAAGEVSSKPSTSTSASPSKSASPSASATPSATPSAPASSAPPVAPPAQIPAPVINSFTSNQATVTCPAATGYVDVHLSWSVKNADYVSVDGASPEPSSTGGKDVGFNCAQDSQTFTLTAFANGGTASVQKTVQVKRSIVAPPTDPPTDPGTGTGTGTGTGGTTTGG